MKVLVAGRGFIGKNVVNKLRDKHELKTLDKNPDATYEQDITEPFNIEERFDVLIHTIGLAPGLHSPESYRSVHVQGTENLLDAVECEKVIFVSALGAGEVDHSFFKTKKKAEQIVSQEDNYTILRPSTVYGNGNKILGLMRKMAPLMIFPNIQTETQPIHIEDLAALVEKTLDGFNQQILELGGPEKMTIGKMAKKIYQERGFPCVLIPAPLILQKTGITILSPLPGPFNRGNIRLLEHQNATEANDAEKILGKLKAI
ncbi:MAG: putative nucleoside-diphosphate-sugar epimerase [Candidatus Nanosalina sp. J07AB43]|nr:MAG: putative nucleoside-diphosphate-sugar epimerase [Candidatus Nanosalina sp. J07AB43]